MSDTQDRREANSYQIGGDHYRKTPGEQHWDRAVRLKLDFFQYMITKYTERAVLKNGKQDVQKALHFCQKWLESWDLMYPDHPSSKVQLSVDVNVTGLPEVEQMMQRLEYLLKHVVINRDGMVQFPDGSALPCVKGLVQQQFLDFVHEGQFGTGVNVWTCIACRTKVETLDGVLPHTVHTCPAERVAAPAHGSGEQEGICKKCDQRAVPQVCGRTDCPHEPNAVNPMHVYDKHGRDKALFDGTERAVQGAEKVVSSSAIAQP